MKRPNIKPGPHEQLEHPRAIAGLALLVLPFAACAMEVDSDPPADVTVTAQAIHGGTITLARPEVAYFEAPTDAPHAFEGCTATMLNPRWFLSAAHCIGFRTSRDGGRLSIDTSSGKLIFPVSQTFSLGAQYGLDDVALGFLDGQIPSPVLPGQISVRHANSAEFVTMMGYGCDHIANESGGKKRVRELIRGSANVLCPGDSGGPAFLGGLAANGDIALVHSQGEPDRFGDPVVFKEWIEQAIRDNSFNIEAATDRFGGDYATLVQTNAITCAIECYRDASCRAWTFNESTRQCFLKAFVPDSTPKWGFSSGLGLVPTASDRVGGDFTSYAVARAEICAADCARDTRCSAYTFASGTCWLKSSVPGSSFCGTCESGNRKGIEGMTDRPGADFRNFASATALTCSVECAKDERCMAFTFNHETLRCFLKDHVMPPVARSLRSSGVRRGYETNMNRAGNDLQVITLQNPKPWICQAACARNASCRSWSVGNGVLSRRCVLKNGIPVATQVIGQTSGRKGMEFF